MSFTYTETLAESNIKKIEDFFDTQLAKVRDFDAQLEALDAEKARIETQKADLLKELDEAFTSLRECYRRMSEILQQLSSMRCEEGEAIELSHSREEDPPASIKPEPHTEPDATAERELVSKVESNNKPQPIPEAKRQRATTASETGHQPDQSAAASPKKTRGSTEVVQQHDPEICIPSEGPAAVAQFSPVAQKYPMIVCHPTDKNALVELRCQLRGCRANCETGVETFFQRGQGFKEHCLHFHGDIFAEKTPLAEIVTCCTEKVLSSYEMQSVYSGTYKLFMCRPIMVLRARRNENGPQPSPALRDGAAASYRNARTAASREVEKDADKACSTTGGDDDDGRIGPRGPLRQGDKPAEKEPSKRA